jgi:hypothetical protein
MCLFSGKPDKSEVLHAPQLQRLAHAPGVENQPDHTVKVWTALTGSMVYHPSPKLTRPPWTASCPPWACPTNY